MVIKAKKVLVETFVFLRLPINKNIKLIVTFRVTYKKVIKKVIKKRLRIYSILKAPKLDKFNFCIL